MPMADATGPHLRWQFASLAQLSRALESARALKKKVMVGLSAARTPTFSSVRYSTSKADSFRPPLPAAPSETGVWLRCPGSTCSPILELCWREWRWPRRGLLAVSLKPWHGPSTINPCRTSPRADFKGIRLATSVGSPSCRGTSSQPRNPRRRGLESRRGRRWCCRLI